MILYMLVDFELLTIASYTILNSKEIKWNMSVQNYFGALLRQSKLSHSIQFQCLMQQHCFEAQLLCCLFSFLFMCLQSQWNLAHEYGALIQGGIPRPAFDLAQPSLACLGLVQVATGEGAERFKALCVCIVFPPFCLFQSPTQMNK